MSSERLKISVEKLSNKRQVIQTCGPIVHNHVYKHLWVCSMMNFDINTKKIIFCKTLVYEAVGKCAGMYVSDGT